MKRKSAKYRSSNPYGYKKARYRALLDSLNREYDARIRYGVSTNFDFLCTGNFETCAHTYLFDNDILYENKKQLSAKEKTIEWLKGKIESVKRILIRLTIGENIFSFKRNLRTTIRQFQHCLFKNLDDTHILTNPIFSTLMKT